MSYIVDYLNIVQINRRAHLPEAPAHIGDAGYDLRLPDDFTEFKVQPGKSVLMGLGFKTEFSPNMAGIIQNKSGVCTRTNLMVGACVIDSSYRGEWHAHLINCGSLPVSIIPGMKIAQVVFTHVCHPTVNIVNSLGDTSRGEGRMGSTGV